MAARQERDGAVEVDGEAAFDAAEDDAGDAQFFFEAAFELGPGFFAARFVAREDRFAHRVFDAIEEDFDIVADGDFGRLAREGEFLESDLAFGLQTDVDDREFFFDGDDAAFDDVAFFEAVRLEALIEQGGEIFLGGIYDCGASLIVRAAAVRAIQSVSNAVVGMCQPVLNPADLVVASVRGSAAATTRLIQKQKSAI